MLPAGNPRETTRAFMKVIVADKISDRGVQLLEEQPGWNIVLTAKDTLNAEIVDADALIVRSATKVTAELLDRALEEIFRGGNGSAREDAGLDRTRTDRHGGRGARGSV